MQMKRLFTYCLLTICALTISAQEILVDDSEHTRLTNLPHVYINTYDGKMPTSKNTELWAELYYVDEENIVTYYDSLEIRCRGNSTYSNAGGKYAYRIKFASKQKLLGKGYAKAKKWTLLANQFDKTLIRNALTALIGERAGLKFNPAAKFVDLTLNGNYVGTYQLSDQVEVRAHRVKTNEQDYPLTEDSDISGGYLLESDGFKDFHTAPYWDAEEQRNLTPDGFYTTRDIPIRIHYPEAEELDPSQADYIHTFIQQFENILMGSDFADPERGYRQYVDSTTLANWYLCTEMTANIDGFFSTYFYKHRKDDRLYWGPLWDYDIAYNNDNRTRGDTNDTSLQLMKDYGYGMLKEWIRRMWQDPWFAQLLYRRYTEMLDGGMEEFLNHKIDSLTQLIDASQQLNYQRWGISTRTLRERVLYSTYDQYIADLRNFLKRHLPYLKTAFAALLPEPPDDPDDPEDPEEPEAIEPDFPADSLSYYTISNLGTGTFVDVDEKSGEIWGQSRDEEAESQQWRIIPLQNGYRFIVNRVTGYALNDPTEGNPTATTLTGAHLNVVEGDSLDARQQWDIVAQSSDSYNLINRFSQHGANLSGGNAAPGTPILSYTNDARNASSNNRKWRLEAVGRVEPDGPDNPDDPDNPSVGIGDLSTLDYALAYDPQSGRLHFGSDNLEALTFPVRVYDRSGRLVRTFRASAGTSLASLPRGLYLITWTFAGHRCTVKLLK
jgi:hypothetical protein